MSYTDTISNTSGLSQVVSQTYLNGFHLPERVVRRPSGPPPTEELYDYDGQGRLARHAAQHFLSDPPMWRKFDYDALGRLIVTTMPDGSRAVRSYTNLTLPNNLSAIGSARRETDTHGRSRFIVTDGLGRTTQVLEPPITAAASWVSTQYGYDARSNLVNIASHFDASGTSNPNRRFRYDGLSRMINRYLAEKSATLDDSGDVVSSGTWSDAYQYDDRSRLTQHVDPRGVVTTYDYRTDPLDRLFSIKATVPGAAASGIAPVPETDFNYQTTGNPLQLSSARSVGVYWETYHFDKFERITDISTSFDQSKGGKIGSPGGEIVQVAVRDGDGNIERSVVEVVEPLGKPKVLGQWSCAYDAIGAPEAVQSYPDPGEWGVSALFGASGEPQLLTFSSGFWKATEEFVLDPTHQAVSQHVLKIGGKPLLDYRFAHGAAPDTPLLAVSFLGFDQLRGTADAVGGLVNEYGYDGMGRLNSAITRTALPPRSNGTGVGELYSYDLAGNRLTSSGISYVAAPLTPLTPLGGTPAPQPKPTETVLGDTAADGQSDLTFDLHTNHVGTNGYLYDAAGNITRLPRKDGSALLLTYDALGRVARVQREGTSQSESYLYDYANQLIVVNRDTGLPSYLVWRNPSESSMLTPLSSGSVLSSATVQTSVSVANSVVAQLNFSGGAAQVAFIHHFPEGTYTTSPLGTNATAAAHLPYGSETLQLGASFSARYQSYARSRFGLDYAINRFYDPETGRYIQTDPLGERAYRIEDPQSLNLYAFVRSDPIDRKDPMGMDDCAAGTAPSWLSCVGPAGKAIWDSYQTTVTGQRDEMAIWGEWSPDTGWWVPFQDQKEAFPTPWKSQAAYEEFKAKEEEERWWAKRLAQLEACRAATDAWRGAIDKLADTLWQLEIANMRGAELGYRDQADFFEAAKMGVEAAHEPILAPPSLGMLSALGAANELAEAQQESNTLRLTWLSSNDTASAVAAQANMKEVCGY